MEWRYLWSLEFDENRSMTLITRVRCKDFVLIAGDNQLNDKKFNQLFDDSGKPREYQKVSFSANNIFGVSGVVHRSKPPIDLTTTVQEALVKNQSIEQLADNVIKAISTASRPRNAVILCSSRTKDYTLFVNENDFSIYEGDREIREMHLAYIIMWTTFYKDNDLNYREMVNSYSAQRYHQFVDFNLSLPQNEQIDYGSLGYRLDLFYSLLHHANFTLFGHDVMSGRSSDQIIDILNLLYHIIDSRKGYGDKLSQYDTIKSVGRCTHIAILDEGGPQLLIY